jgi:hypothetical protein
VVVWVAVVVVVVVRVSEWVYVSVWVQLAGGVPKNIPLWPIPENSQRPFCPMSRQKRLPLSQSAPTSL